MEFAISILTDLLFDGQSSPNYYLQMLIEEGGKPFENVISDAFY